jgi:GalNAc-alpha-(1->4)-GalNAc-alpha-(1->3)-diNAcBac-PP-undecaprenol alpha-1,4-N-acetyl-D-galactosaminyltransferase
MKIFLIIPTLRQGGAERVMSELANEFAKQKHEVHLILLASVSDFYGIDNSISIHRLAFVNRGRFRKLFDEMKVLYKLRNLLSLHMPDATLSFMDKFNIFTLIASYNLKIKVFVSDRSNPYKKIPIFLSFLKVLTYNHANGIIAQTQLAKNILAKKTKNKNIKVIPNPLKNIEHFPEVSREKIILNVGRLIPEKGHKYLLEAFSKLEKNTWRLVILGDGPLRDELQDYAKVLKIEDSLYMPGLVKNVDEWLSKSSIFAFTSVSEGFPNALVEAMAAGLPCISFDCDAGPRDIIEDGVNGFLSPLYDVESLFHKIALLIENPQLRLEIGLKATSVRTKYEKKIIAEKYLDLFNS